MYNRAQFMKDLKASKAPKKLKKPKDVIVDPAGQWAHPGEITKIPSGDITMHGVPYPVMGIDDTGYAQMMYPGTEYQFPGDMVTEYPMAHGGQIYDRLGRLHSVKSYVPKAQSGIAQTSDSTAIKERLALFNTYKSKGANRTEASLARIKEIDEELRAEADRIKAGRMSVLSPSNIENLRLERDGLLEGVNSVKKQNGGWLDTYQNAGEYKWDPSQMQTQPQVTLPTVGTYSRSAQNTTFDNPYRKPGVVEQAIEKDKEMAYRALPMNVRGEAPAEYVPIEMALMPASLPIRGASLLGRAGKFTAEALNPLAGMRNIGSKLVGRESITKALEPEKKKLLHDLRVAGSIYDSNASMLDKLKSIAKLDIDDTSLKKLIGKTKQELKTHIDELTERYVTKKQPYKLGVDSDIDRILPNTQAANMAANVHEWLMRSTSPATIRRDISRLSPAELERFLNTNSSNFFRNRLKLAKSNMQHVRDTYKYQDYEPLIHGVSKKADPNPAGVFLKATKKVLNSPKGSKFYPSGSLSTDSNNAALGLIENLVKKGKIEPKFMRHKPLNSLGYLSKAGVSPELILQEMNDKIADINRLGKGNKIPYGYIKEGQIMYPDIGIIRKMLGGYLREGGSLTSTKAKEILRDGTAHGKKLTPKQKRYFGWIAGGRKQYGGWLDNYNY